MVRALPTIAATAALLVATTAFADDVAITAKASVEPSALGPGDEGRLTIDIDVPEGWHLWALDPGPGPMALRIRLDDDAPITLVGPWQGTAPHEVFDRGFQRNLLQYGEGKVQLQRRFKVRDDAVRGSANVAVSLRGQICTDATCLTQKQSPTFGLDVLEEAVGTAAPAMSGAVLSVKSASAVAPSTGPATGGDSDLERAKSEGIFAFLLFAFVAGLGALATPCVFPAIPMTVSFFSKYSEKSFGHGVRLAAFYAVSMMFYFTAAGLLVSVAFGVSGLQEFASHPIFNIALAGVLIFFAFSLMGWFKIQTPAWAYDITNKLEMKYGPNAAHDSQESPSVVGDYVAVGVAAMTSTTVFFTCTVAFVGSVLVAAADGQWFWPTLGMLAFSGAFVLPFFLLAVFPNAAARMRGKSGSWIKAVSVSLGFVEFAAAWKFLSNADLVWQTNVISRDLVLAIWVALFAVLGLFLIGKLDMRAADEPPPTDYVSVPRVLAGLSSFVFALFLAVSLFNQRPLGGWIDGWLPPPPIGGVSGPSFAGAAGASNGATFEWIHDLEQGRRVAAEERKLVFVNYTGFTCTNCRYMESGVFPKPKIANLLNQMTLVELYTDGLDEEHDTNREDQITRFKTAALPFYSVETADGAVIATFPSSTNDPEEFRQFLADAIAKGKLTAKPTMRPATVAPSDASIVLMTTRLSDGAKHPAIVPGKWSLVNFWATWCSPCRKELEGFLAKMGSDVEAQGGRFAAVAIEDDETVPQALDFMKSIGVPATSALRLPGEFENGEVDPKLDFSGDQLPYTVLVSPAGQIVWKHAELLDEATLRAVLTEHMGFASLR